MLRVTYLLLALIALAAVGYTHVVEHGGASAPEVALTVLLVMVLLEDFVKAILAIVEDD